MPNKVSGKWEFGVGVVQRLLPQRPPLLMVDGVRDYQGAPRPSLRASRAVSPAEPWVAGHFPGLPILPGALIIEGLAQACGLLRALRALEDGLASRGEGPDWLIAGLANLERGYRLQPGYDPQLAEQLEQLCAARRSSGLGVLGAAQVKLLRPVVPGERLDYQVALTRELNDLWHCEVAAEVDGDPVASGSLVLGRTSGPTPALGDDPPVR